MGYPYGERYLEQIQGSKTECERIKNAFYALRERYLEEHGYSDHIELTVPEQFEILGEAFAYGSNVISDISDEYHFIDDVVLALLTPKEKPDDGLEK